MDGWILDRQASDILPNLFILNKIGGRLRKNIRPRCGYGPPGLKAWALF